MNSPTTTDTDWLDDVLFQFADYIKHHERTGLGGNNHQGATKQKIQAHIQRLVNEGRKETLGSLHIHVEALAELGYNQMTEVLHEIDDRIADLENQLKDMEGKV